MFIVFSAAGGLRFLPFIRKGRKVKKILKILLILSKNKVVIFRRRRIVYPVQCGAYFTGAFSQFHPETEKQKKEILKILPALWNAKHIPQGSILSDKTNHFPPMTQ